MGLFVCLHLFFMLTSSSSVPKDCFPKEEALASSCLRITNHINCTAANPTCYFANHPTCSKTIFYEKDHHIIPHTLVCFPADLEESCFMNSILLKEENEKLFFFKSQDLNGQEHRRRLSASVSRDRLEQAELILHPNTVCPELVNTCIRHTYTINTEQEGVFILLFVFFSIFLGSILKFLIHIKVLIIPYTTFLFAFGIFLGWVDIYYWSSLSHVSNAIRMVDNINPHVLLAVFIPPLVFESAFSVEYHIIKTEMMSALTLAGPGVIMNTFLIACLALLLPYKWSFAEALLFGCVASATDPIAVVALLREMGASKRLATLIEGESLLNDGTAFVIFVLLLRIVRGEHLSAGEVIGMFMQLVFGGIAIGVIAGFLTCQWLKIIYKEAVIEISLSIFICYSVFHVAEVECHCSGVLAVVALGFVMSRNRSVFSAEVRESLHSVWETISYLANTMIFLIAGIIIAKENLPKSCQYGYIEWQDYFRSVGMYVGVHVTRMVTILMLYPILERLGYGLAINEFWVIVYGGLRGAIGLALALLVLGHSDLERSYRTQLMFHISGIVLLTLFINATTMGYLVKSLRLSELDEYQKRMLWLVFQHRGNKQEEWEKLLMTDQNFSCADWKRVMKMRPEYQKIIESAQLREEKTDRSKSKENNKLRNSWWAIKNLIGNFQSDVSIINTFSEELMVKEMNHRLISVMRAHYLKQFEAGMLSPRCFRILMEVSYEALDKNEISALLPHIESWFKIPHWVKPWHAKGWYLANLYVANQLWDALELTAELRPAAIIASRTLEHSTDIKKTTTDELLEAQKKSQIELNKVISTIERLLIEYNDSYAYLQCHSHTHRAVAKLLHLEIEALNEMYQEGVLDDGEKSRLLQKVDDKLAILHYSRIFSSWKVKKNEIDNSKELMENTLFMYAFVQRAIQDSHRQEIFEKLSIRYYKEGDTVIQKGDKATIVLITPPWSFGTVHIEETFLWYSVAGELFAYDFLCNQPFSISMTAKTNMCAYHITKDVLDLLWKGLTKEKRDELYQQLWLHAATQVIRRFFPSALKWMTSWQLKKMVHKSELVHVKGKDSVIFYLPNGGLLLKGGASILGSYDEERNLAPLFLSSFIELPYTFSIGSVVLMFSEKARLETELEFSVLRISEPKKEVKREALVEVMFEKELLKIYSGKSLNLEEIVLSGRGLQKGESIKNLFVRSHTLASIENISKEIKLAQIELDRDLMKRKKSAKIEK